MPELTFIDALLGPDRPESTPGRELPDAEALDAYSRVVTTVAERLTPSVANLRVSRRVRGGRTLDGGGSGVVITPDGYLLTSAHVVDRASGAAASRRSPTGRSTWSRSSAPIRSPTSPSCGRTRRDLSAAELGDAEDAARRPARRRDRQPARLRRLGDRRRGLGARPVAADALGRDDALRRERRPDRRGAEPGQLRRRARRRPRPRRRDQHRSRGSASGWPCRSTRDAPDRRRADDRGPLSPRLPRRRRRRAAAAAATRARSSAASPRSRWSRSSRTARRRAPACGGGPRRRGRRRPVDPVDDLQRLMTAERIDARVRLEVVREGGERASSSSEAEGCAELLPTGPGIRLALLEERGQALAARPPTRTRGRAACRSCSSPSWSVAS